MLKIKENKTRKRLRLAQCTLFLFQIVFCTSFSFVRIPGDDGQVMFKTVFDMLGLIGSDFYGTGLGTALPVFLIFPILPVIGFFFCALDKERNLKNVVSIICCLVGVFAIINFLGISMLTYGSIFALLNYILISFITAVAFMARLTKDAEVNTD